MYKLNYIYFYFRDINLHLNNRLIRLIPDKAISIYIILDIIGMPQVIKVTRLKFNKPTKPQFKAPITTRIKDSLSNMFILHIKISSNYYLKYIYENIK